MLNLKTNFIMVLNKVLIKKDHYETELSLEFKNCEIIQHDNEYIYIKVNQNILNTFSEIKKDIIKIVKKNPELYCDCKKIIHDKETFEEVIKVERKGIPFSIGNYDVTILLYKIWFGKSSYGPIIKVIEAKGNTISFLKEESDSDDEIERAVQNFCSN
jgi:hypothetical protein